jgi:hypothetical protein
MARKLAARKGKRRSKPSAKKAPRSKGGRGGSSKDLVQTGMHDLTNLATAVKAYLELLTSQGHLEEKQKYYADRAREQMDMMADLVRDLRKKLE